MTQGSGRFLRDNVFLVAAVSLPLLVVAFFMLSSAIPRWTVPPPAYDLVFRADGGYGQTSERAAVDFSVRDGKVEATIKALAPNVYLPQTGLFLFDHATMTVREIPIDVPSTLPDSAPPRTFVVGELARRMVLAGTKAPDGYQLASRGSGSPGLVGELFGMNRYDVDASLANRGRVVRLRLPSSRYQYPGSVSAIGWLAPDAPGGSGETDGRR